MDAAAEVGRNPVSKHQIQPGYREWTGWCGTGRLNPSRETKFSGTHGDRGMFIFPVQLTTSRVDNLTRPIHTLLYVMTIHNKNLYAQQVENDWFVSTQNSTSRLTREMNGWILLARKIKASTAKQGGEILCDLPPVVWPRLVRPQARRRPE